MTNDVFLRGLGHYAPEKVLTNADLEKMVDTNDEWITSRTGIKERRIVAPDQSSSDLAVNAARMALKDAGMEPDEITHIVVGTFTPDYMIPSCACIVQSKLNVPGIPAFDVAAACSGFMYALTTARGLLAIYPDANVLVCAVDVVSRRVNYTDRSTCILFGDAAGAVIISNKKGLNCPKVLDSLIAADGSLHELLTVKGGGSATSYAMGESVGDEYFVQMSGRETFKHAVRNMCSICEDILKKNGRTKAEVGVLIPHQANWRIIDAVGRKLEIPAEKVFSNIEKYGNTSAASIPVALSEARESRFINDGDLVLLTSFGGGLSWASALIQF